MFGEPVTIFTLLQEPNKPDLIVAVACEMSSKVKVCEINHC